MGSPSETSRVFAGRQLTAVFRSMYVLPRRANRTANSTRSACTYSYVLNGTNSRTRRRTLTSALTNFCANWRTQTCMTSRATCRSASSFGTAQISTYGSSLPRIFQASASRSATASWSFGGTNLSRLKSGGLSSAPKPARSAARALSRSALRLAVSVGQRRLLDQDQEPGSTSRKACR